MKYASEMKDIGKTTCFEKLCLRRKMRNTRKRRMILKDFTSKKSEEGKTTYFELLVLRRFLG